MIQNKALKRRIIEISHKYHLSHIGSCLTAVDIIKEIYATKKPDEKFVLSSGHAGLALYVVIEKYEGINAEKIFKHHGVHPDRCGDCSLSCSSGSLGHGLSIAVGMALADRSKDVYCLISDGECSEGSIWEALNIRQEQGLWNLKVYLNFNGWGAYKRINGLNISTIIYKDIKVKQTNSNQFPFLKGQAGHYAVMTDKEYKQALEILK